MPERRWERLAPLTGIVAVALWLVAVLIIEGGDRPGDDATAQQIASYYDDETGSIFFGFLLWAIGFVFFVWFVGTLRGALALAEGGVGRVAAIAGGGGLLTAAFALAIPTPGVAAAIAADEGDRGLSPEAAEALFDLDVAFFVGAEVAAIVLLLGTALVVLRTRVLPVWLGWASVVLAVGLIVFPIGWAVLIFGVPLWTLAVSVLLWQRGEPVTQPVAP